MLEREFLEKLEVCLKKLTKKNSENQVDYEGKGEL